MTTITTVDLGRKRAIHKNGPFICSWCRSRAANIGKDSKGIYYYACMSHEQSLLGVCGGLYHLNSPEIKYSISGSSPTLPYYTENFIAAQVAKAQKYGYICEYGSCGKLALYLVPESVTKYTWRCSQAHMDSYHNCCYQFDGTWWQCPAIPGWLVAGRWSTAMHAEEQQSIITTTKEVYEMPVFRAVVTKKKNGKIVKVKEAFSAGDQGAARDVVVAELGSDGTDVTKVDVHVTPF